MKETTYRIFLAGSRVLRFEVSFSQDEPLLFFDVVGVRYSEPESILAIAGCSDLEPLLVDDDLAVASGSSFGDVFIWKSDSASFLPRPRKLSRCIWREWTTPEGEEEEDEDEEDEEACVLLLFKHFLFFTR